MISALKNSREFSCNYEYQNISCYSSYQRGLFDRMPNNKRSLKNGAEPPNKREKSSNTSAIVLQKRREGRQRANEKLQTKLEEIGIKRADLENELNFSSISIIPLINQKNYFTDYLKKDEQFRMIRLMKERIMNKIKNKKDLQKKNSNNNNNASNNQLDKLKEETKSATGELESETDFDDEIEDEEDENDNDKEKTLIFHPGSNFIKFGFSDDIEPKIIGNIVGYKLKNDDLVDNQTGDKNIDPKREIRINIDDEDDKTMVIEDETFLNNKKKITNNFKERMRYYKRRILPNSNEQCFNFNKKIKFEKIQDYNDIQKIEFVKTKDFEKDYIIGDEIYKIEDINKWKIRSPFLNGSFNESDLNYKSREEILSDIELLIEDTMNKKFSIEKFNNINVIFVIPNLYKKSYVESMMELLLIRMGFKNVSLIQESIASTFGAGISSGCIVDIGANSTKICCLEEGLILENSQIELNYGSNDLTRFFIKNLIINQFPYKEINLEDLQDWKLSNELKESHLTFNDANVAIQLFKFIIRKPNIVTKKFEFKCFDEVMVSSMGLFYPEIFLEKSDSDGDDDDDENNNSILFGKTLPIKKVHKEGIFENKSGKFEGYENKDPISFVQELEKENTLICEMETGELIERLIKFESIGFKLKRKRESKDKDDENNNNNKSKENSLKFRENMTPLDKAIIESITVSGFNDQHKMDKFYSNIFIVGGGSKIDGLDNILVDRIHINRNKLLSSSKFGEIYEMVKKWKFDYEGKDINSGLNINGNKRGKRKEILDEDIDSEEEEEEKEKEKEKEKGKKVKEEGNLEDKDNKDKDSVEVEEKEDFKLNKKQLHEINTLISSSNNIGIEILPNSDIDPSILAWKGGSVYARLKIVEEMWVNKDDWDMLGSRSLKYASLFNY